MRRPNDHHRRFALSTCVAMAALVAGCHRDKPEEHLARGKEAAAKQDHAAAVIEFKNVLQADPNSAEARFWLGRELLAQNDPRAAEIELQKALDAQYDPDKVMPLLIRSQLVQGQVGKVVEQVGKGNLKTPAANAAMQTLLGGALIGEGKVDDAAAAYAAALRFVPDYPEAVLGEARVKAVRGDFGTAQADVANVLAKDPKLVDGLLLQGDLARTKGATTDAIASYEAAIKESPRNFGARLNLAGAYVANRQYDEAQKQVDELKKQSPKQPGVNYMDALIAFNKKDYTRASNAIALSLSAAPKSALSHLLAGATSIALNQPAQAETNLRDAVNLNPGSTLARKLLANLYLQQRQPQKAAEVLAPALAAAPNDPATMNLASELAMQKGDFATAQNYLERIAKLNPGDANIRTQSAAVDFARGDEAGGFAELEAASKASTDNPNPDIALVLARVQRKQFDQALVAWKTLQKRQPDNPITYNLKAAIDIGRNDMPGARQSLERAVELKPNYLPAVLNLVALDERDDKVDDARQRLKTLISKEPGNAGALLALAQLESRHGGGPDVVLPPLKEARRANPASQQPVVALAAYYVSRNDPRQALAAAQDGLAQAQNDPVLLNLVGQLLMRTGSTDQAIATFRKRVALNPESIRYQMDLGYALIAAKQNETAVQVFEGVLRSKPDATDAQGAAVSALLRLGKVDDAARLVASLRTQNPKSQIVPELDGDVKLAAHQFGEAATIYRQQLARNPSQGLLIKAHTAMNLGGHPAEADAFLADWIKAHPKDLPARLFDADVAMRAKNFPRAVQGYRAALEVAPNDPMLLNNLAWALWQTKDAQALGYAEKAAAAAPDNPAIGDTLGWMLVEQGQAARGLPLLEKASAGAPGQRDITLHLAKAQLQAGKKDAARTTLRTLIDDAPDSAEAKESHAIMATL